MSRYTAIVLAGGQGKRMQSSVPKQYLLLKGEPVLYYSLKAFEDSPVDEVILVTGKEEIEYCKREIVEKYHFSKVRAVVAGGKERYDSVYQGLLACENCDYVLIHDGARPFIDQGIIARSMEGARTYEACAAGMPSKDTIKIVNKQLEAVETPDRTYVYQVQTPQSFAYERIREGYEKMYRKPQEAITDDAMIMEKYMGVKVQMIEGSYRNIKITTPEDLLIGEAFLGNK